MHDLIREKLRGTLPVGPEDGAMNGDFALNPEDNFFADIGSFRPAAVLVPIITRPEEMTVLLTRRPDYMNKHAGQIAFPGGGMDEADKSPVAAALREAEEEVGLDPATVEIVGRLDPYRTGTGYQIVPIVGFITPDFEPQRCEIEVAEIFEVPFSFLMDPVNHQRHQGEWRGKKREYYAVPYEDYYIWGATAGMLVNLSKRLAD